MSLRARFGAFLRTEVGGLARDSFHVGIWQASVSIADVVQLALITHVLGLSALGRLALVTSLVILVGQFFDVRVATATTRFGAARLADGDYEGFAGLFQLSYAIDAAAGILSFIVVASVAPFVGPRLVGDDGTTLILLYALTLLFSTVDETSGSVLRLLDRFRLLSGCSVAVEALRIAAIGVALAVSPSLKSVLFALIAYDLAGSCVRLTIANRVFLRRFGWSLRSPSIRSFQGATPMLRMVLQTNVVSYARIAQVQLPTLLLGVLSTTTQVGYYKVGSSAAAMIGRLADPAYAAVLPRLARLWVSEQISELRDLVRRSTVAAASVMGLALLVVAILREPILSILGGSAGHRASTVLLLASVGQAVNGALFWNTGLLFAAGRAGAVARIAALTTVVQVGCLIVLTPFLDADGAAAAFFASYVVMNAVTTTLALRTIRAVSVLSDNSQELDDRRPAARGRT